MRDAFDIRLPGSALPFHRTVRCYWYIRQLLPAVVVPVAAAYASLPVLAEIVGSDKSLLWAASMWVGMLLMLMAPSMLLGWRLLVGSQGFKGMLYLKSCTETWRRDWQQIATASKSLQEKCRRQRSIFALPHARPRHLLDDEEGGDYSRPDDVLADIPHALSYVTFGDVQNQPLQAFDAGTQENARAFIRLIAGTVAGRLLGRDVPFIVMQRERRSSLRLTFLTDVHTIEHSHGFVWLTLHLETSGTLVAGFVESVRTLYFARGRYWDGFQYRGDEAKAKELVHLAGESLAALSPFAILLSPWAFWQGLQELFSRKHSARFYGWYRPEAGDSVDLFLIGEVGTDVEKDKGFESQVEGLRNKLTSEVLSVMGTYGGVLGDV